MECPHQISFNEITTLETDEQNISQIDLNSELLLAKSNSLEEFLGMEDESTEISFLVTSMDKGGDAESVSEILGILKKQPHSSKNNNLFKDYVKPFGTICRPICIKNNKTYPERVSRTVNSTSLTLSYK
jgi:hypothetical protein